MKCKDFLCQIDPYLTGKMSPELLEVFELHYFKCDACFLQLKIAERLYSKEVNINGHSDNIKTGGSSRVSQGAASC